MGGVYASLLYLAWKMTSFIYAQLAFFFLVTATYIKLKSMASEWIG